MRACVRACVTRSNNTKQHHTPPTPTPTSGPILEYELFDLAADPYETKNVYHSFADKQYLQMLHEKLQTLYVVGVTAVAVVRCLSLYIRCVAFSVALQSQTHFIHSPHNAYGTDAPHPGTNARANRAARTTMLAISLQLASADNVLGICEASMLSSLTSDDVRVLPIRCSLGHITTPTRCCH